MSVLGRVSGDICDESTAAKPVSHYGATKLRGEAIAKLYRRHIVFRPSTAFGSSPQFRPDLLVHQFTALAAGKGVIDVYEPHARRSFIHVRDISSAIALAIRDSSDFLGNTFHLGDEELNITKLELANSVAGLFGAKVEVRSDEVDLDARDYFSAFDEIRKTGFRATESLSTGIIEAWGEMVNREQ